MSEPERVGEILPRVLAQIEAAALARWRATTWASASRASWRPRWAAPSFSTA